MQNNIILASKSPRRSEILKNLGVNFDVVVSDSDESCDLKDPSLYVEEISKRKGFAVKEYLMKCGKYPKNTIIISADTVVAFKDTILGKPHSKEEAFQMMTRLSDSTHNVVSGITILTYDKCFTSHEITKVNFTNIPITKIKSYIETEEPYDKAGGYAIQGWASSWISGIEGDYFNVVGLPVCKLNHLFFEATGEYLV